MKRLSVGLFLMLTSLTAMELERFNIQEENDAILETDGDYTEGMRLSAIFGINEYGDGKTKNKLSLAIGQEMYTPLALSLPGVIMNDRPYAGFRYVQGGLHQFEENTMDSVYLLFGTVGERSKVGVYQLSFHEMLGVTKPEGWDNQIHNEWIYQINYEHQSLYNFASTAYGKFDFVPNWSIQFGNAARKIKGGAKIGWRSSGMADNFYVQSSRGGFEGFVEKEKKTSGFEGFIFANGGVVLTDIFLDGNNDGLSHSVEKERIVADFGLGLTWKHKDFTLSLMNTWRTAEHRYNRTRVRYYKSPDINEDYVDNRYLHSWSSLLVGYNF